MNNNGQVFRLFQKFPMLVHRELTDHHHEQKRWWLKGRWSNWNIASPVNFLGHREHHIAAFVTIVLVSEACIYFVVKRYLNIVVSCYSVIWVCLIAMILMIGLAMILIDYIVIWYRDRSWNCRSAHQF